MNKAIIFHGTEGSPAGNWYPWLKDELEKKGWQVWVPTLPDADWPNMKKYLAYLNENLPFAVDEKTVFIGHSSGAAAALAFLQSLPATTKIKEMIGVSAFWADLDWDRLKDFQNVDLDYAAIKAKASRFIFIHSDNDPYVPMSEPEKMAQALGAQLKIIKNQGHFNLEWSEKYKNFPKLLAMILKESP